MDDKGSGRRQSDQIMRIFKSKPTEWPLWIWLIVMAFFGAPTVLNIVGIKVPTISRVANPEEAPKEIILKLADASQKTTEAINLLATDYKEYRARSDVRLESLEKNLETLREDIRELRARIK